MRKALSKSMLVMAAASGILTAAGGYAQADASADGSAAGSPGVGSGNAVQVPVHVPVNVCGNTVNVVGLLNPAFGNTCENASDRSDDGGAQGASAVGGTSNSPVCCRATWSRFRSTSRSTPAATLSMSSAH